MPIVFDVQTILFMNVLLGMCLTGAHALSLYDRFVCPGARFWVASLFSATIGLLFLWLRLFISLWISVIVGNGALILGYAFLWLGFRQYTKSYTKKDRFILLIPIFLAAILFLLLMTTPQNISLRSKIVSYAIISMIVMVIIEALKNIKKTETGRILCIVSLSFTLFSTIFRAVTINKLAGNASLFENNISAIILLTTSAMSLTGIGLGVMLISSQWLQRRLYVHATHDALTGLYNRYSLTEMNETLAITHHINTKPWCVVMIDIDHFKLINDKYGHHIGDIVIQNVANILKDNVRHKDLVTRYGGEEFVVVLLDCDMQQAKKWAERVRRTIYSHDIQHNDEHQLHITASFGVAAASSTKYNLDDVIQSADTALYCAKRGGRNQVNDGCQEVEKEDAVRYTS
ncbi:MAG: GGDEF domain-containing protein [Gammaproteobacteria bacterium]|nr:GGDEF domain-containing protein [Gammaproteobacteria bacterium]